MVFKRIKKNLKSDYAKRQFNILGNIGLFYLILISMLAIPLLCTIVVVLIQSVHDFRHIILGLGLVAAALLLYFTGRFFFRFLLKLREDGLTSFRDANRQARDGAGKVQIDICRGLISFTVNAHGSEGALQLLEDKAPPALPAVPDDINSGHVPDPVRQIRDLQELLMNGAINKNEFEDLKAAIVRQAGGRCRVEPDYNPDPDEYSAETPPDMDLPSRYSR
jgi:hypothetical protein